MAHTTNQQQMRRWNELLAPFKQPDDRRAVVQILNSLLPFVGLWLLAAYFVDRAYWLTLLLAVPLAGFFIRLFIIQHDCGHGSFFSSRKANDLVGSLFGLLTLFPYGYWKRTHAVHHATHGNLERRELGDVETLTVREYKERTLFGRLRYRLYRNPAILFGIGPIFQFLIKHRLPFDIPWAWKREWMSVLWNNLVLLGLLVVAWQTGVLHVVLGVHVPVVLLAGAAGIWLFYVQHQFEDAYWAPPEDWSFERAALEGSSFYDLPPVLRFFSGNIGFHHIHHLASRIPNYRLHECMLKTPELQRAKRLTLWSSLQCLRFRLWCEERKKMVGFGEI